MRPEVFDNSYARLPERFFHRLAPEPSPKAELIRVNRPLSAELGLDPDWLASNDGIAVLSGNTVPEGADPIATVYAGHQFGSWNPQLGDGRALLLGEVVTAKGERFDLQLKGSGRTPYSRGGDGKAPLGPVLREYVVSEAMASLGIPTTRALAAVTTGETVYRTEREPGAVLARVARSHIRVGTFEYFASRDDAEGLQLLTDHVIERHYPELADADDPVLALLGAVADRQARLIARWQLVGFIHGVMNTDNMLVSGETIDYGPCAFLDRFDPATVYSSIDHQGRYAYGNQPGIANWNLARFAQALLPVLGADRSDVIEKAQGIIDGFGNAFVDALRAGMHEKLGLSVEREDDDALVEDLFSLMKAHRLDFTLTFRRLAELAGPIEPAESVARIFDFGPEMEPWLARWRSRFEADPGEAKTRRTAMFRTNPALIARNHLVEGVIRAGVDRGDFGPFERLVDVLAFPAAYDSNLALFATPPRPEEEVHQTFCGT